MRLPAKGASALTEASPLSGHTGQKGENREDGMADDGVMSGGREQSGDEVWDDLVSDAQSGFLDVGDALGILPGSG